MIAVIYARYSDSRQTEQSIEGQLKVCYKYSLDNGYTVVREYIDRAQSGKTDDRIQFRKMMEDSKHKQFDTVIVYALDRFGRNLQQTVDNEYKLQKNNVALVSATEHTEDSPAGTMQRNILMTFAQYYSDELAQKVTRGLTINAEKGLSNGGQTPLGYKIVDRHYVIDENTAPIVQEIFTKYADGISMKQIYDDLNSRGLTSSKSAQFNKCSLNTMLKNRKYLGIYMYMGIEKPGGMPQIISEDLFNKVAEKMVVNKSLPARSRAKAEYLLTSKLFCGYCKEMMIGHSSNRVSKGGIIYNYYKCKNAGAAKTCKKKMAMKDYIENLVIEECRKLLTPQNIRKMAKAIVKIAESYDDKAELNRLSGLIQKAQKEKENQMVSLRACDDDMIRGMIFEDLSKIGAEIKELERQYKIEETRHEVITEKQIIDNFTRLAQGNVNDIAYRKSLIKIFVNKIFLYDDRFTITFNSGDEEVTITDIMLSKIENEIGGESVCLLNEPSHQLWALI